MMCCFCYLLRGALERRERRLAMRDLRAAFFSAVYRAIICLYACASAFAFTNAALFAAFLARLRWRTTGVIRRWILGRFTLVCPPLLFVSRPTTNLRTSSPSLPFFKLKSLRIFEARLGPRR